MEIPSKLDSSLVEKIPLRFFFTEEYSFSNGWPWKKCITRTLIISRKSQLLVLLLLELFHMIKRQKKSTHCVFLCLRKISDPRRFKDHRQPQTSRKPQPLSHYQVIYCVGSKPISGASARLIHTIRHAISIPGWTKFFAYSVLQSGSSCSDCVKDTLLSI